MARETRKQREDRIARESRAREDANATRRIEADARAKQAEAEAMATRARSEAETLRIRTEAEASKRWSDAENAARQAREAREPAERLQQLGINIAAPAAGYIAGVQLAKNIGKKHAAGIDAANKQLKALGAAITKTIPSNGAPKAVTLAKLAGMVKSADALRLASRPAALGFATAAVILGEGAFARFVLAPKAGDNKVAAEAIGAVGTVSIFAATTLVGKRLIANATTTALPDAKAVAAVETARKLVPAATPPAAATPPSAATRGAKVVRSVPKSKAAALALAAAGAGAVAAAASGTAEAKPMPAAVGAAAAKPGMLAKAADIGLTTATTVQAARLASSPGLRAAAGILSKVALPVTAVVAIAGGVQGFRKTGTLGGTLEGAADGVTGGGYTALKDMIARSLKTAEPALAASGKGSVAVMQSAAGRVSVDMGKTSTMARPAGPAAPRSDGRTDGYTRQQNGKAVFVKGYSTPAR